MALPARFHQLAIDLDAFLSADIGEEESGAPLSVLSGLTRLGIDPWMEGSRLSDLTRDDAARALVPMIAMLPKAPQSEAEIQALAEKLASLLPQRRSTVVPGYAIGAAIGERLLNKVVSAERSRRRPALPSLSVLCIGLLLVLCAMAFGGILPGQ